MITNDNHLFLWDIDGTLMHCGSDGTMALNKTFEELYGIERAFSRAGIGSAMDAVILERIIDEFQLDKKDLERIIETYVSILKIILDQNQNKRILPGIRELLTSIKESKNSYNALLTSNLRLGAETKLQSVGLHSFFEVGGFGDELGEKWDAAVKGIEHAQKHYDVVFPKDNIFLIGDSIYDIECAKKIGIKSIGVATGWMEYQALSEHNPDYLYQDLSDWEHLIIYQKLVKEEVVK